jgi:uridine kinase
VSPGPGGRICHDRSPDAGRDRWTARCRQDDASRRAGRRPAWAGPRSHSRDDRGLPFSQGTALPRGEYSAEGCYFDTHDYDALNRVLLDPLGPGGDRRFQQAVYDRRTDTALCPPVTTAPADAVLLFDGVFLLRPELVDRWDLRLFVSTAFAETVDRAMIREQGVLSAADVARRWRDRYIPSQQFYFAAVRPADLADIVVYNDELQRPAWEARTL